jgi:hypothetical protein
MADQTRRDDPMAGRRAWIRVDGAEIAEDREEYGTYRVRITGHNLRLIISPPRIEVGGVRLEQVTFDKDGKTISGTLPSKPEGDRVVVDYGFARDEGELEWEEAKR